MTPNLSVLLVVLLFVGKLLTVNVQAQDTDHEDIERLFELVEDIEDNVEDVEDDIDEVRGEIEDIEDKLDELGMEIESMETNVHTIKTEFKTHTQSLKNDTQCIKEGLSNITSKSDKMRANLESKLAALEAELKENTLVNTENYLEVKEELANLRDDVNSTLCILQEIRNQLASQREEHKVRHQNNIARLCSELHPTSPSDYYWLRGLSERVYCDMDRQSCGCGRPKGWIRVAQIDMTDPNQQCPEGFGLRVESGIRMCEVPPHRTVCVSIMFPTYGVQYSRVCGMVKAYQYASTDAFFPYYHNQSQTIDDIYVDGVSVTHGTNPRKHIWTFAAGIGETLGDTRLNCPCHTSFIGEVPPFIERDYFCDTGVRPRGRGRNRLYTEDPLWDGEGCGPTSSCCQFNSPPWFCKDLPQPTTDDIEVRVCSHMLSPQEESTPFELIDIAVQ